MTDHGYDEQMAAIYDAMTAARDDDVEFYVDRATAADGPVLELAVGSGRIYLDVLESGVDADGVDVSPEMLDVLRDRAAARGLDATVWEGDMTDLAGTTDRAIEGRYDLVYCPFNALQHARSVDDQQAVFESVYDALVSGGRFVFDVFVPNFELIEATYGEWQPQTVDFRGSEHELRTRSQFVDEPRQIVEVENQLRDLDGEVVHETSHRISPLPYQQVELLARASPFDSWDVQGGFDGKALEDGDAVQVWTLEREA
ncbi:type 12 methyltransferase [Salinarchaeum sp. Harcht-Bsk1]|uniref:class I SAM-dependent DNA methyltransferase n=1 Tax=Salinarchaeum sp. Harcht-Bsk1 TaxID=1333523 RepID=UPI0003423305|nr:class I SAM-dependent methyltransferase [Salinarchaeum sp. Harcht-Bsk1]AGN00644.1 type 12 methyltransferase [Salinarchaeum sp. Harcht-Bsk1]